MAKPPIGPLPKMLSKSQDWDSNHVLMNCDGSLAEESKVTQTRISASIARMLFRHYLI